MGEREDWDSNKVSISESPFLLYNLSVNLSKIPSHRVCWLGCVTAPSLCGVNLQLKKMDKVMINKNGSGVSAKVEHSVDNSSIAIRAEK